MLSRKEGRSYSALLDGERFPSRMNRKRTDAAVKKIESALKTLRDELKKAYEDDYGTYMMLSSEVFDRSSYQRGSCSDGRCPAVDDMLYGIENVREILEGEDDEFPTYEETVTLRDIGFRDSYSRNGFWEKVLEDDGEKEVVEEIQNYESPLRRIRTTVWEKTDYGRKSKSITYRKLPIGKKLRKTIENTARESGRGF